MKKSKYSEEQIVRILKGLEAGATVSGTTRNYGISEPTYYAWTSKYAGMDVGQRRRLKDPKAENTKLEHMYADLALTHHALQDVLQRSSEPGGAYESQPGDANGTRYQSV